MSDEMCSLNLSGNNLESSNQLQTDTNLSGNIQELFDTNQTKIFHNSDYAIPCSSAQIPDELKIKYSIPRERPEIEMSVFLQNFATKVNGVTNNEKQKDEFFNLCADLIGKYSTFVKGLNQEDSTAFDVIDFAENFVTQKLRQNNSAKKRQR